MNNIVNTPCGPVRGGAYAHGVAYKGIRYATAGRWEYPKEVTAWEGTYDATAYGACSYQPRAFYDEEYNEKKYFYYKEFRKGETYEYSEDCLFLNIFTPENAKEGDKLPVLFYIHGGGFTGGCGHEKHFDGPLWPEQGIIGVTVNYRLGPMGFVTLPELKEEAGFTGNYGLYDQLEAMKWVRRNIAAFGGDPENVTIMGQSAGAMSVQQHCMSPLSDGLFHRAVLSSGGGVSKMLSAAGPEKSYDFWHALMEKTGCADLAAFRALPAAELFAAWNELKKTTKGGGCFPCLDGRLVVGTGDAILRENKQKQIHYMMGSTSEDMMPPILLSMVKKWCEAQAQDSFVWFFDRQLPGDDCGAWHSSDLWYWFGTLDHCWRPLTEKDRALSHQMMGYLANFCRTGDPNGEALPRWAPAKGQKEVLRLGENPTGMAKVSTLKLVKTMLTNKAVGE